jgi:hypothetical protein
MSITSDPFSKAAMDDASEVGKQHNNNELNIQSNSSVTDEGLFDSDKDGDTSWRDAETNVEDTDSPNLEDPNRATSKPEDDIDFVK